MHFNLPITEPSDLDLILGNMMVTRGHPSIYLIKLEKRKSLKIIQDIGWKENQ